MKTATVDKKSKAAADRQPPKSARQFVLESTQVSTKNLARLKLLVTSMVILLLTVIFGVLVLQNLPLQ